MPIPAGTYVQTPLGRAKVRYYWINMETGEASYYNVMPENEESGMGWAKFKGSHAWDNYAGKMVPAGEVILITEEKGV